MNLTFLGRDANLIQAFSLIFGMVVFLLSGFSANTIYLFILLPALVFWVMIKPKLSTDGYIWLLYLLYVLFSSFWSNSDSIELWNNAKYVLYVMIFLYALELYKRSGLNVSYIFIGMFLSVLSIEVLSIGSYVFDHGVKSWFDQFPRLFGVIGVESPIDISCVFVLSTIALMACNKAKPLYCILGFLIVSVLISPFQTRISILGLGIGILVVFFQNKHMKMIFVSVGAAIFVMLLYYFGLDRFSSNEYTRLDIWQFAFDRLVEDCHMIYGCGFGYDFNINVSGRHYAQLHSLILSQFFYGGLLGFIAFSVVVIRTLWVLLKNDSPWFGVLVCSLVILMTNRHEIISNPNFVWVMLWVPIGLSGILFKKENIVCVDNNKMSMAHSI